MACGYGGDGAQAAAGAGVPVHGLRGELEQSLHLILLALRR